MRGVLSLSEFEHARAQPKRIAREAFGAGMSVFGRVEPVGGRRYPARIVRDSPLGAASVLAIGVNDEFVELDDAHPLAGCLSLFRYPRRQLRRIYLTAVNRHSMKNCFVGWIWDPSCSSQRSSVSMR